MLPPGTIYWLDRQGVANKFIGWSPVLLLGMKFLKIQKWEMDWITNEITIEQVLDFHVSRIWPTGSIPITTEHNSEILGLIPMISK